jgi:interferon gamma-inducible protein 30
MFALLAFATVALCVVAANGACSIPPSLWCDNPQIAKKCGVEDQCEEYARSFEHQKVKITLLYEALCGGCQEFIHTTLYPEIYQGLGSIVEIQLVPYGNAKNTNGTIVCQHGPTECDINKYESCAINYINGTNKAVPFIACLENEIHNGKELAYASTKCYKQERIGTNVQDKISTCHTGPLGDKLQMDAAQLTDSVWPIKHKYVPWVLVQGVSLNGVQSISKDLPLFICQWYIGPKPAACPPDSVSMPFSIRNW